MLTANVSNLRPSAYLLRTHIEKLCMADETAEYYRKILRISTLLQHATLLGSVRLAQGLMLLPLINTPW